MSKKRCTVNFYRSQLGLNDDSGKDFRNEFQNNYQQNKELNNRSAIFGFKFLDSDTDFIFGEIRKYRDDAPHIGMPQGADRPINLNINEFVLEKSFLLYSLKHKLYALVTSDSFRSPACFTEVFNNQGLSENVTTAVVLGKSAHQRLINNKSRISSFDCAIVNPSGKTASTSDNWGDDVLSVAGGATGRMSVKITGDMRGSVQKPLKPGLVDDIWKSVKNGLLDRAIAKTTTGETIDILEDRLRANIKAQMSGRYPDARSVQDELINVFQEYKNELVDYLN